MMTKLFLIIPILVSSVLGDGVVSVKLVQYNNPLGTGSNGHCCDGKWTACQKDGCDHQFTICIDEPNSNDRMTNCKYALHNTDEIDNEDINVFGDSIGGVNNPIRFPFTGQTPTFSIKVKVVDDDGLTMDDDVDYLRSTYKPGSTGLRTMTGRTSLDLEISIDCSEYHYGVMCIECHDTDQYICAESGDKYCLSGWSGPNCDVSVTTTTTARTTTSSASTTTLTKPSDIITGTDCNDLAHNGYAYQDGVYKIITSSTFSTITWCNMDSYGDGWTLIQRNINDDNNFDKTWREFRDGFGSASLGNNYWIGLENMYLLTNRRKNKLSITMRLGNGEFRHAQYGVFRVESEQNGYKLVLDEFSGNAGDALSKSSVDSPAQNGMPFSTKDRDNDNNDSDNCAKLFHSGWWYSNCYQANLNGQYVYSHNSWPKCTSTNCVAWNTIEFYKGYSLTFVEMMIMPADD